MSSREGKAEYDGGHQNLIAVAVEEGEELSGWRPELRLIAVKNESDDCQEDEDNAGAAPLAFPVKHDNLLLVVY
jgi:hypothetical protein